MLKGCVYAADIAVPLKSCAGVVLVAGFIEPGGLAQPTLPSAFRPVDGFVEVIPSRITP